MSASESDCQGCAAALPLLREAGEALERPLLVGIGGQGGSGKSSFASSHLILRRSRCGCYFAPQY